LLGATGRAGESGRINSLEEREGGKTSIETFETLIRRHEPIPQAYGSVFLARLSSPGVAVIQHNASTAAVLAL
jgi:hypothetical protein